MPGAKIRFEADPIGDGAFLLSTFSFAGLLELVLSTGEIRPQQIDANFNTSNLLGIDRGAISQHIDPQALFNPKIVPFRGADAAAVGDAAGAALLSARAGPALIDRTLKPISKAAERMWPTAAT